MTRTLNQLADTYDNLVSATRDESGFYEITGDTTTTQEVLDQWGGDEDVSYDVVSEELAGWGDYDHYIRIDFGVGTVGYFARLKAGDDINTAAPVLYDLKTGDAIRNATAAELSASIEAAESDGGVGAIEVDGTACYVVE